MFTAPRALLLGVQSKIVEVLLFHVFVEQGAINGLLFLRRPCQQGGLHVRRDERVCFSDSVVTVALPRVGQGFIGHLRSYGIELDVAVAGA